MENTKYVVFISHSSKDKWIARQMARLIEELDVWTFLNEKDIEGGDAIHDAVRQSIQGCDELLVLMSEYSLNRPWVLIEIGAAWGLEKRVVPIVDKVAPDQMPDILYQQKAVDLNDFDEYLTELSRRAAAKT